jgi:hypothetical protein
VEKEPTKKEMKPHPLNSGCMSGWEDGLENGINKSYKGGKVVKKEAYKRDGATSSQSPTTFLHNSLGDGILWLFRESCQLLVLFCNPPILRKSTLMPINHQLSSCKIPWVNSLIV